MAVITGLERLIQEKESQQLIQGQIGILCHSASVTSRLSFIVDELTALFGARVKKLFGPQHGLVTDVQDNMVETDHTIHPYYQIPVYSLYSETRDPTSQMLEGLDTLIVDLQDVGTRVYTYISTLTLMMQKAQECGLKIVVLDRPNPVGGELIEGALSQEKWGSFVSQIPGIPMRHSLTMGEVAQWVQKHMTPQVDLEVVQMKGWHRGMFFQDTGLPWVPPSPNLPTPEGAQVFPGSVLFEGTNISEGRGTTRSLEQIGHPALKPHSFARHFSKILKQAGLQGQVVRAVQFVPMFQKHAHNPCGGVFIHPTSHSQFRAWAVGQLLLRELYRELGSEFKWNDQPYEYETQHLAIDYINSGPELRTWVESMGSVDELFHLEQIKMDEFKEKRREVLIYSHQPA